MKQRLIYAITISLLGVVAFLNIKTNNNTISKPTIVIPNNIDYYLKNTRQKSYNKDGSIGFTLNSDLLEHYKKEDKSTLIKPDAEVRRKSSWRIKANKGDFDHPKEIINFSTNVQLDKLESGDIFQVHANALLFNIQQDLVISESDVKVMADSWYLNAKSMTLDMNSEVHQFTQVTARYRHDKNF